MPQLYHYTSVLHWPSIWSARRLTLTESNLSHRKAHAGPDVVWFTTNPRRRQGWQQGPPGTRMAADKSRVRLTVTLPDDWQGGFLQPWLPWAKQHGIEPIWLGALARSGGDPTEWWVTLCEVGSRYWTKVEDLETGLDLWPLSKDYDVSWAQQYPLSDAQLERFRRAAPAQDEREAYQRAKFALALEKLGVTGELRGLAQQLYQSGGDLLGRTPPARSLEQVLQEREELDPRRQLKTEVARASLAVDPLAAHDAQLLLAKTPEEVEALLAQQQQQREQLRSQITPTVRVETVDPGTVGQELLKRAVVPEARLPLAMDRERTTFFRPQQQRSDGTAEYRTLIPSGLLEDYVQLLPQELRRQVERRVGTVDQPAKIGAQTLERGAEVYAVPTLRETLQALREAHATAPEGRWEQSLDRMSSFLLLLGRTAAFLRKDPIEVYGDALYLSRHGAREQLRLTMEDAEASLKTVKDRVFRQKTRRIVGQMRALLGLPVDAASGAAAAEPAQSVTDEGGAYLRYSEALEQHVQALAHLDRLDGFRNSRLSQVTNQVFSKMLQATLIRAETFYWTRRTLALVEEAAPKLPPEWALTRDLLPCPQAFVWLERPLQQLPPWVEALPQDTASDGRVCALSWAVGTLERTSEGEMLVLQQHTQGSTLVLFTYWVRTRLGYVTPLTSVTWPFGVTLGEVYQSNESRTTWDNEQETMQETDRAWLQASARTVAAMLAFEESRILSHRSLRADRNTRRRIGFSIPAELEPGVQIVQLRRYDHSQRPLAESEPQEWNVRWWVRGHWHSYWYKQTDGSKTLKSRWLLPYIKGPEGKPIKPAPDRLFVVAR